MIRRLTALAAAFIIMAWAVTAAGAAGDADKGAAKADCPACPKNTYRLAVVTKPGAAQTVLAEKFARLVSQASGGRTLIYVYHSGAKGDESQILEQLRKGDLHLAVLTAGVLDNLAPQTRVVEYPFLFHSHAQADRVLQGAPGREVLDSLREAGLKGLAFGENGFRHLTNNLRPVKQASDLKGLRVRVMESALQRELWQRLGAVSVPHPWPIEDLLSGGGADGQENPLWVIWLYRLDKLQKYLTLTGHVYSAHICAANLAWYEGLPSAEREMLERAMVEAAAYQRELNRRNESQALGRLKEAGIQVVEHPDLASFRQKTESLAESPLFAQPKLKELLELFRRELAKP